MRVLAGAIIALILLGLYTFSVGYAAMLAMGRVPGPPTDGIIVCITTIGGLVSALVIAELAITTPDKDHRGIENFGSAGALTGSDARVVGTVSAIYLLVWIILGLLAFIIGVMMYPDVVPALTNLGMAWLGLAVAAAYAYFGLNKPPKP